MREALRKYPLEIYADESQVMELVQVGMSDTGTSIEVPQLLSAFIVWHPRGHRARREHAGVDGHRVLRRCVREGRHAREGHPFRVPQGVPVRPTVQ